MTTSTKTVSAKVRALGYGASLAVLSTVAAAAIAPSAALAQAAPTQSEQTSDGQGISNSTSQASSTPNGAVDPEQSDDLIVTGQRAALRTSQQIKRDADTVVDTITATDIGAFPDKSVAEALQRVAGITVNRFAASSDTSHFSAEPSGVIVRGLQQVRSEFNGRDTFSANSSRGLSWGDVSPELMAGVDTYKNQTAELIEGGIAGSINLRTRVPFDSPKQLINLTANLIYGDLSQKLTPEFSGIYSNRWTTSIGEFGLMADYAYSKVQTESQGIQYTRAGTYIGFDGTNGPDYGGGTKYIPGGIAMRDTVYDRTRNGFAIAGQWQDLDHKFLVTGQYNRSTYDNVWHEHGISSSFADILYGQSVKSVVTPGNVGAPEPAPGTDPFTFDENGFFQSGVLTSDIGWWGADNTEAAGFGVNDSGQNIVNACYGWNGCSPSQRGPDFGTSTRYSTNRNMTEDASFNVKWNPSDRLHMNFDLQHVHSTVKNYDMEVGQNSFANIAVDGSNGIPNIQLLDPTNVNLSPGFLTNPDNYYYNHVSDHMEDSEGTEWAARADAQYDIGTTWLDSLKVGYRYADRDQTVRWTTYNWANIANTWTCNQQVYFNIDRHDPATVGQYKGCGSAAGAQFAGYQPGLYEPWSFSDSFFGGGHLNQNQFIFANMDALEDHDRMSQALGAQSIGVGAWNPLCSNTGTRSREIPGTCYTPGEIAQLSETTNAVYAMLKFGGRDATIAGFRVSGNIGARYVITKDVSVGALNFAPSIPATQLECRDREPTLPGQPVPVIPRTIGCYISAEDRAFADGGYTTQSADVTHHNLLPSFNLKVDLSDKWLIRFAASRAMARPDIGLLKNYTALSSPGLPSETNANAAGYIKDANGTIIGVAPIYKAEFFNPYLKPITADQFDISLENYFASVGQFSISAFYKKFHDYVQYGLQNIQVTNNGVTRTVEARGPLNGDGASVQGFEVAYQRFFDFLPSPFNGLGVQANFTYVHNKGIQNTGLSSVGVPGQTNGGVPDTIGVSALEGLSKYSYNLVGMYEKGPLALRLAYNWRSEYLVTLVDCCVLLPVWNKSQGFLDASIRYSLNGRLEVSLEAQNLLNTKTVLEQQVTDEDQGNVRVPNAWFQNDRRFQVGLRAKF